MAVYSTAVCDGRHKFGECPCPLLEASQAVEFFGRSRVGHDAPGADPRGGLCQVPARRRRRRVGALTRSALCLICALGTRVFGKKRPRRSGANGYSVHCGKRVLVSRKQENSESGDWFHNEKPRRVTGLGYRLSVLIVGHVRRPPRPNWGGGVPFSQHRLKIDSKRTSVRRM
jgi:hypothetical protein